MALVMAYFIPGFCHWTIFGSLHMPGDSVKGFAYVFLLFNAVVGVYHAVLYVWSFFGPMPIPTYYVPVAQKLERVETD